MWYVLKWMYRAYKILLFILVFWRGSLYSAMRSSGLGGKWTALGVAGVILFLSSSNLAVCFQIDHVMWFTCGIP